MENSLYAFQILSAMITPAVLISASGLLVLSTSNRLSRVVDRVRVLADKVDPATQNISLDPEYKTLISDQLSLLARRAILLRSALTCLYLAITLFVLTSISLGISSAFRPTFGWIPVLLAMSGTGILLFGSVLLISEGRQAIDSTLQEMKFIRRSVASHNSN